MSTRETRARHLAYYIHVDSTSIVTTRLSIRCDVRVIHWRATLWLLAPLSAVGTPLLQPTCPGSDHWGMGTGGEEISDCLSLFRCLVSRCQNGVVVEAGWPRNALAKRCSLSRIERHFLRRRSIELDSLENINNVRYGIAATILVYKYTIGTDMADFGSQVRDIQRMPGEF